MTHVAMVFQATENNLSGEMACATGTSEIEPVSIHFVQKPGIKTTHHGSADNLTIQQRVLPAYELR